MEFDQISMGEENTSVGKSALKETRATGVPFSHNLFLPGATTITPSPSSPSTSAATQNSAVKTIKPRKLKLPQTQDQLIREASLVNLLKNYKPSKLSKQHVRNGVSLPLPLLEGRLEDTDILFGRGNRIGGHPGNCMMRKVVALNQTFYRSASRQDKHLSADAILGYFESRGVRFVEEVASGKWRHVAYSRVVEKIMQALREKTNYRNVGLEPSNRVSNHDSRGQDRFDMSHIVSDDAGKKRRDKPPAKSPPRSVKKTRGAKKGPAKAAKPVKVKLSNTTSNTSRKSGRSKNPEKVSQAPWSNIRVGDRLGIYWDGDAIYYPGTVEAIVGSQVWILYDDQEKECLDLSKNEFLRWNERLKKRVSSSAAPLVGNTQPSAPGSSSKSVSSKGSPVHSIRTQESSDSGSIYRDSEAKEDNTISIQGSFTAPVVAPAPSLASFLRKKIESNPRFKKVTQITVSNAESAIPVVVPSLASFLRQKMETSSSSNAI